MSIAPGLSRVVAVGGTAAAPNTPYGKVFGSSKTVKSVTLNPPTPLEYGRTVSGGEALKATAASSISGTTGASGGT